MKFPEPLSQAQAAQYEAIFAAGDGELLLREWEVNFAQRGGSPDHPLSIEHLKQALRDGQIDFAVACLRVLPDRFFDLKQLVVCRSDSDFHIPIYTQLRAFADQPQKAAGYHAVLELMLRRGWDAMHGTRSVLIQLTDIQGVTPLLRRLLPLVGGAEAVRRYSDSFCGARPGDDLTSTMLHHAVGVRDVELVRFLISEVGIEPNTVDRLGRAPLQTNLWILGSGFSGVRLEQSKEVLRELVRLGADIEHRDSDGVCPLLHAVKIDNEEAVQFLLDLGADPTVRDGADRTLLQIAEAEGSEYVARLLRSLEMAQALDDAMSPDDERETSSRPSAGLTL